MKRVKTAQALLYCCSIFSAQAQPPQTSQTPLVSKTVLSGRILDESGTPRAAEIALFQVAIRDGHRELYPRCRTGADATGEFVCDKLDAGNFLLQICPHAVTTPVHGGGLSVKSAASFYYPGITDIDRAELISLTSGESKFVSLTIPSVAGQAVSGLLKGIPHQADVRLYALFGHLQVDSGIELRPDWKKQIIKIDSVPDGHYELTATWIANKILHVAKRPFAVNGADVSGLELRDQTFAMIHGTIISHGRLPNVVLLYRCDDATQRLTLPVTNGEFSSSVILPGSYFVALPVHRNDYVSGIIVDGKASSDMRLSIQDSTNIQNIRLELSQPGGAIQGSIADWSTGAQPAQIVARADSTGQFFTIFTDRKGHFRMSGLAPGEYSLCSWPGQNTIAFRDPQELRTFKRESISVNLSDQGVHEFDNMELSSTP